MTECANGIFHINVNYFLQNTHDKLRDGLEDPPDGCEDHISQWSSSGGGGFVKKINDINMNISFTHSVKHLNVYGL